MAALIAISKNVLADLQLPDISDKNNIFFIENNDFINQLSKIILQKEFIDVHLIAHGDKNSIETGNNLFNLNNIDEYADQISQWKVNKIFLWCCEIGKNQNFIKKLKLLTGAEVFSSKNLITQKNSWIYEETGRKSSLQNIVKEESI